jgi:hypothetical protein
MKNKSTKLLLLIGISVIVVALMYFVGNDPISEDEKPDLPRSVVEFRAVCDSLKLNPWSNSKYGELKAQFESLKSQQVFNSSDAIALEEYLDLAYAYTLQKACRDWQSSDGNSADPELLKAMESVAANPACEAFVSNELETMRTYFKALQIPSRVNYAISQKFDMASYNQLISDINRLCGRSEISHFNRLRSISSGQQAELDFFKTFAQTYEGRMASYIQDPTNTDYLLEFCPVNNPNTKKYEYYLGDITSIPGLCP